MRDRDKCCDVRGRRDTYALRDLRKFHRGLEEIGLNWAKKDGVTSRGVLLIQGYPSTLQSMPNKPQETTAAEDT